MAKYFGSPFGEIKNKVGSVVGGDWKGIKWIRAHTIPENISGVERYLKYLKGEIPTFNFPQFHIRQMVVLPLGKIGKLNLVNLIWPVWQRYCDEHNIIQSGLSLYVRRSLRDMYNSIPNKDILFDPVTNRVNYAKMNVSVGMLEPTPEVTEATYVPGTGVLTVGWKTDIYSNGLATDIVHLACFICSESFETYTPMGQFIMPVPAPAVARSAGVVTVDIPLDLTADYIYAFLYFRDVLDVIGYSPSVARKCIPA